MELRIARRTRRAVQDFHRGNENRGKEVSSSSLPPSLSLSIYRRNWAVSMQFSRLRPRSIRDTPRAPPLRSSSTRKNKIFLGARKSAEPPVSRRLRSSHPTMTVPFHRNSAASLEEKLFALLSLIMLPRKRYLLLLGRERGHPVSRSIN